MEINSLFKMSRIVLLIITMQLFGCGFVSDKPPGNVEVFKAEQMQTCKIDINEISKIFKTNQSSQILCIKENFLQYTNYVLARNSQVVSEFELDNFVKKFYPDQSDSIIKALSIIFQLNMLLFKDEEYKISRSNISPLFDFLIKINQVAVNLTDILNIMSESNESRDFWGQREKFTESITKFSQEAGLIIKNAQGGNQRINIQDFITRAGRNLGSKEITPETIDTFIFIKKILLGGDKEIITSEEIGQLIEILPKVSHAAFDFIYAKQSDFSNIEEYSRFKLKNAREFYSVLKFEQEDFKLFTIDQIISFIESREKNKNVGKFKSSIVSLKKRIIGGSLEYFFLSDAKSILDIYHDYIEKNYFNAVTYASYIDLLEKDIAIPYLEQLNLPDRYDLFSLARVTQLHKDFVETAKNIRYFRNQEGIPYIGNEIRRNQHGFLQSNMTTWMVKKLLKSYGHKNDEGIAQLSVIEFKLFLDEMEPLLKEFGLWSPNPSFPQNAVLLADLFQNRSDGDQEVNTIEATEYAQMIFSSGNISEKFNKALLLACDFGINKNDPIFDTTCFNNRFFEVLLNDLRYKKYFPSLYDYFKNSSQKETDEYLIGVEGFAREGRELDVPINNRDSSLVFGAMINIESTFVRFDLNGDNVVDYDELLKAYDVYKNTIVIMAKLKPGQEAFAKSIFLYMVSKMKTPPSGSIFKDAKFFAFHKCVSSDWCREKFLTKIEAKRLNIGRLLAFLVKPKEPAF